jgi:hypothetical protein
MSVNRRAKLWFHRERQLFSSAKLGRATLVASLAFAQRCGRCGARGKSGRPKRFMLLLLGIPVFVWMRRHESETAEEPTPIRFEPRRPIDSMTTRVDRERPRVGLGLD